MVASARHRGFRWTVGDASNPALALLLDETNKALHISIPSDAGTDWNVSADSNPSIYIHSDTTPATDYLLIGRHTGTAADIDLVGAATLNFKIDGTAEALLTASILDLASTDLQMQAGGQILDDNGNELIEFVLTASAVNGIKIRNNSSGQVPWITNEGGADIGLILGNHDGTNWEEIVILGQTATAVNEFTLTNAATANAPNLAVTGGDTNIDMLISTKGTGLVQFNTAGNWTANSTATVSLTSLGPAGIGTSTIDSWLTVKKNDGTVMYIPAWT